MKYTIAFLVLGLLGLAAWILHLKHEIGLICQQLEKRQKDGATNSISTALLDPSLVRLAADVNRSLDEYEKKCRVMGNSEKQFRDSIANISHDLRTPLTSVKGYLQLLDGTLTQPQQHERMSIIRKHTDELGDLIEHFFEYACLLSDESEVQPVWFSLTDETVECLAAAVPQLEERGLSVQMEEEAPVRVFADREKTVRIIQNLVRNCIQHAAGDINVRVTQDEGYAVLVVSNPAANPETIDPRRLFDRFYTADPSRRRSTGLGLSIVRLLAAQLGGSVSAAMEGERITFTVLIPM